MGVHVPELVVIEARIIGSVAEPGQATSRTVAVDLKRRRDHVDSVDLLQHPIRPRLRVAGCCGEILHGRDGNPGERIEPVGLPASRLGPTPRGLLGRLVALYLDRLPIELAARSLPG